MGGFGLGYYTDTYQTAPSGVDTYLDTYNPDYIGITPMYGQDASSGVQTSVIGLPYSVGNPDGTLVQQGTLTFAPTSIAPNGGGTFQIMQSWDPALGQYITHMYDEFGNPYYVDEFGNVVGTAESASSTQPVAADTYAGTSGEGDTYLAYDESTGTYYKKSKSKSYSSSDGYASDGSSSGDTYTPAFPFADGFGNADGDPTPVYANGMVHPFFGGTMTAGEADGSGASRQMTVPETGATAGPYGVSGPSGGGGGYAGGSAGGGGGGNDFYWNIRNNILGNFGGSGGSYPSDAEYRAAQNAADRAFKKDQKQATRESENQSQFYSLYSTPTYALPSAINNDSIGTPGYNMMSSLPASQLALMTSGYQGKDTYTKRPETFKRTLADLYQDIDRGTTDFSYDSLMNNLFDASNQSTLGRMFMTQKPSEAVYNKDGLYKRTNEGAWKNAPASSQAGTLMSMLNATYGTTLSPKMASAYSANAQQALDAYGENNWNRKNPQSILDYMGNYLGY